MESSDAAEQWALERALTAAGYEVAVCDGPSIHQGPCPLVRTGECALAAGADVILNDFELSEPANQDVIGAHRARRPATPVIVQVTRREAERHADLLDGCHTLPTTLTADGVLTSIREALGT